MRFYSCGCGQCRVHSVLGPLLLVTAGVLLSLDYIWRWWPFSQTWPVLLIVLGVVKVAERMASDAGHGFPPAVPEEKTDVR